MRADEDSNGSSRVATADPAQRARRLLAAHGRPEVADDELLSELLRLHEATVRDVGQRFIRLGDLSHQINNPLTSLLGRAQLLQLGAGEDEALRAGAEVVERSATRVAEHVRELAQQVRDGRKKLSGR